MNQDTATVAVNALKEAQQAAERGIAEGLRATSRLVDLAARLDEQIKRIDDMTAGSRAA